MKIGIKLQGAVKMQPKSIDYLANTVMRQLAERGYTEGTKLEYRLAYAKLKKFADQNNHNAYSVELGKLFLQDVKSKSKDKNSRYMEHSNAAISRLNDCLVDESVFNITHCAYTLPEHSIFDDELNEYKQFLFSQGRSAKVIRYRELIISRFLKYLETCGARKLSDIKIQYFNETFSGANDKTDYSTSMRSFAQYAFKRGWVSVDYTFIIPTVPKYEPVPTIYTPQEIENMLSVIDRSTAIGKRDYAILLIAARLGLRSSDIVNLASNNLIGDSIDIIQVKTNKALRLPLLDEIRNAIDDYCSNARPQCDSERIFVSGDAPFMPITRTAINSQLRKYFNTANINITQKRHGVHTLRSSLASALLEEDNSYSTIQRVLGHQNATTMKHYAKIDINRLRECALPVPKPSGLFQQYLAIGKWSR